ncbi:uncharacterized protein [Drosophila takahashii]|uniref:uncharacterized protein n=1 Tax=Drosophila takahashii TaxID=29030 RepID=UPI001CF82623|nr:histidine-rich glycoprotein [Drosophila takahashii]
MALRFIVAFSAWLVLAQGSFLHGSLNEAHQSDIVGAEAEVPQEGYLPAEDAVEPHSHHHQESHHLIHGAHNHHYHHEFPHHHHHLEGPHHGVHGSHHHGVHHVHHHRNCHATIHCPRTHSPTYATDGHLCYHVENSCELAILNCLRRNELKPLLRHISGHECHHLPSARRSH